MASPQLQARLLLDALECADWDVGIGMRHRHQATPLRVLELKVAALLPDLLPARPFQCCDHLPAAHEPRSRVYNIHRTAAGARGNSGMAAAETANPWRAQA